MPLRIEAVGPRGLLRREVGRGGLGPIPAEREEEVLPVDGEGLDRPLAYVVAHLDVPVGKTMETDKKKPRYNIKCKSSACIQGVSYYKSKTKPDRAGIICHKKKHELGRFMTLEEAVEARKETEAANSNS